MGFASAVADTVTIAKADAVALFGDFTPYIGLLVGVIILGIIIGWFINR